MKVLTNIKLYAVLSLVAVVSFLALASTASAAYTVSSSTVNTGITSGIGGSNLGQLIVLDKLFDRNRDGNGTLSGIGELIVLDGLFNGSFGNFGTVGTGLSGTVNTGVNYGFGNSLGQLIVLDKLFDDNGRNGGNTDNEGENNRGGDNNSTFSDIGELIVLDGLFGGTLGGFGTTVTGGNRVVVQSGDTLSGIASRYLGNASLYPQIAQINGIANPSRIYPGQVLVLPSVSSTGSVVSGGLAGNSLGQLIVLDKIFDNGDNGDGTFSDIGELIVLDSLFNGAWY
jgi:nucleoid-associated protein YgaU